MDTEVLVTGAGPTGLMLACWLARLGVDHEVVDHQDGPTRESRALAVQARSMEIYDQLGMVDAVRDRATWAPRLRPGWQSRPAPGAIPLGRLATRGTPYPGIHLLEQSVNERLLAEHLGRLGGRVSWQHRLVDLTDHGDHVEAELDGPGGRRTVTARWCVGADGASSAVRAAAGISFEGMTNPQTFWLADAHGVRGVSEAAVNVRLGPDSFLLTFPMGEPGHHRVIGVVPDPEEVPEQETLRAEVARDFGVEFDHSTWFTTYRVHHRVASRFRSGRVLLAGDAGHIHSPVGGQGMNTGLQDAHNLAFKLADVSAGRADERLLDRYAEERMPVARRLVSTTDRLFAAVTDPSPRAVRLRRLLVPLLAPAVATVLPRLPVAQRLAQYVGQIRIHYWMSAAERARGRRDPVVGRRLPWTGANHASLAAATWQVHAYGPQLPPLAGLPALVARTHRFDPREDLGLTPGRWLLVRPDGFVAAAAAPRDAAATFTSLLRAHGYHGAAVEPHR
ncbi:FAD-dependent monooxygenase [Georgenia alba]|uniref:FAD-dependent monooxygenase n=1 Tax=Georgenia alba TaxID=2233858 RepID=A0ABW2QD89_9MICO